MASNSFGNILRLTTWGESHGKGIGVTLDGCPAGLPLEVESIQQELDRRAPGSSPYTSPRMEQDRVEILSGLFRGKTTGAPLSLIIWNRDADSSKYEPIKELLRPGHANYTYLEKYGLFDYRGGGRASARETACRVAAGAVALQWLASVGVNVEAFMRELGGIACVQESVDPWSSPLFCPDPEAEERMAQVLKSAIEEGDSVGGVVEVRARGVPVGLGDPVYEKLDANLAKAMMSIPATKGVEFGSGFAGARMRGSQHNDRFQAREGGGVTLASNHGGGVLGGISTGMDMVVRVAFKPTSSIQHPMETVDTQGRPATFRLPPGSRHDPCVAIRGVPVVKAMMALVLADAILMNRLSRV